MIVWIEFKLCRSFSTLTLEVKLSVFVGHTNDDCASSTSVLLEFEALLLSMSECIRHVGTHVPDVEINKLDHC